MRLRILLLLALASVCSAAVAPLTIVNAVVSDSDGGGALPPGFTHIAGEIMFFSFQVEGYKATSGDKLLLTYKIDAFDPRGVRIIDTIDDKIEASLAPEDKNWKPMVHHEVPVPPLAGSGTYKIVVALKDEIAGATATKELPIEVSGHRVDPSDTLVIRNFRFYRGEDDTQALPKAAYRPGDAVWARFDIIGFKYGDANSIDVSYGVTVTSPSGKVLYSEPQAGVDKSQSFYPKRYVPASMSLQTKPDTRPGEYGVVVTAHDNLGNQTYESRQSFTIE
ncbi:MAG: hypothetical protein ABSH32_04445 [Bryobacteraceae bacterium]